MKTRFTSDPAKARRNQRDHGISFETAREVFADLVLVVAVFVDRSDPLFEVIHIISARKAVAYEQSIYQDQIS